MSNELQDRVAVITGAASGIGEASAHRLAQEGARVIVADIDADGAERVAAEIERQGGLAVPFSMDVSGYGDNARLVQEALDRFGRIDIAYANAGIAQASTNLEDMSEDVIDRLISINLRGVVSLARAVARPFKSQRRGVFVTTASTAAMRPRPGLQVYSATKGALIAFVRALALEWAPYGVRACAVSPVATDTPMLPLFKAAAGKVMDDPKEILESFRQTVPLGVLAQPEDIAQAVCFLVSDRARLMTGTILDVDGGRNI